MYTCICISSGGRFHYSTGVLEHWFGLRRKSKGNLNLAYMALTDDYGGILWKCFICHSKTENKKTRRRGYAQSFCRLFDLPSLPYEDQLVQETVFCQLCHENIRQIELLYRKLEKVKEEIINFRILLENQLTKNTSQGPQESERATEIESNGSKILYTKDSVVLDVSEELRAKIISKIQFADSEKKTVPVPIPTPPVTSETNDGDDNEFGDLEGENLDDGECKKEIDWSPPESPGDRFLKDGSDFEDIDIEDRSGGSSDNDSSSTYRDNSCHKGRILSVQVNRLNPSPLSFCTRHTTRSQTALIESSSCELDVKLEIENSCDGSDENPDIEVWGMSDAPPKILNTFTLGKKPKRTSKTTFNTKRKKKRRENSSHALAKTANYLRCTKANCKYKFPDVTTLNAHVKRYHEGCTKPYSCTELNCSKSYKEKKELSEHLLVHSGTRPFMCEFCAKTFYTAGLLRSHTRNIHLKSCLPLKCSICSKGFESNSALETHMRKHTKDYPYKCECGLRVSSQLVLNNHKRAHNEEFKCTHCKRVLSSQSSLEDHILIHTKLYPLKCSKCDFGASNKHRLKEHMSWHDSIKVECQTCKKKVAARSMNSHMKTHDPERPKKYVCDQCGKAFVDNYKLKRHVQYHRGDKPFQCSVCGKSFYTRDYLNIHMKYHEKSGVSLRNQTRKPRIWKHSVLPNPNIEDVTILPCTTNVDSTK